MARLVVEVLDAGDLMPKDGHGSASPFVEVEFEEQRHRTSTKPKDLNPYWNEKLVFNIKNNPRDLLHRTIEVFVYNDNKNGHHRNFLGKVRISGMSVPMSEQEATVQRYPLDKRGIFSHVKGDIALRMYVVHGSVEGFDPVLEEVRQHVDGLENHSHSHSHDPHPQHHHKDDDDESDPTPLQEINTNKFEDEYSYYKENQEKAKKKKKEREAEADGRIEWGGPMPPLKF